MGQGADRFRPEQAGRTGQCAGTKRWSCLWSCKGRSSRGHWWRYRWRCWERGGDRRRGRCGRRSPQKTKRRKTTSGGSAASGATAGGKRGWLPTSLWSLYGRERVHSKIEAIDFRRGRIRQKSCTRPMRRRAILYFPASRVFRHPESFYRALLRMTCATSLSPLRCCAGRAIEGCRHSV